MRVVSALHALAVRSKVKKNIHDRLTLDTVHAHPEKTH